MEMPGKYIDFCTDYSFKRIFGQEDTKDLLISFLNSILLGREKIVDLTYLNTEQIGIQEWECRAFFDVYCCNDKGEHFIVEMQLAPQLFFKDRSIYYSSFAIQKQAPKGNSWNFELNAVYMVCVLDFIFDSTDKWFHNVMLFDKETNEVFYDKLNYVYIELPKFNKGEDELTSLLEKWVYLMRHLYSMQARPVVFYDQVFDKVFEVAEIANLNEIETMKYEENLKNARDWYSVLEAATVRGEEKGHQEGLQEGLQKGKAEASKQNAIMTVKFLRKKRFTDEEILISLIEDYGLSQEDANEVLKNADM